MNIGSGCVVLNWLLLHILNFPRMVWGDMLPSSRLIANSMFLPTSDFLSFFYSTVTETTHLPAKLHLFYVGPHGMEVAE